MVEELICDSQSLPGAAHHAPWRSSMSGPVLVINASGAEIRLRIVRPTSVMRSACGV